MLLWSTVGLLLIPPLVTQAQALWSALPSIVHQGQPYVATDYGYYPLQKTGDDFFFTGKAKVTANAGDVIVAGVFFGIIGGLIASDASALFEMKLDHLNGGFMRIREIK